MNTKSAVKFIRKNGRVIPIRAAGAVASAGVGAIAVSKMRDNRRSKIGSYFRGNKDGQPNRLFQAAAVGLNIGSGVIAGMPVKGIKKIAATQAASFGIDALATSLNAASVRGIHGSKKAKLKAFARAEAISQGIGYATWGATLLANPAFRKQAAETVGKVSGKAFNLLRRLA